MREAWTAMTRDGRAAQDIDGEGVLVKGGLVDSTGGLENHVSVPLMTPSSAPRLGAPAWLTLSRLLVHE